MHIILDNFKLWPMKSLDIPENGMVLINGKSGTGKSSILESIVFGFFGIGAINVSGANLCNVKKKAKVSITLNERITIERSVNPYKLYISNGLQEGEAQEFINNTLWGAPQFSNIYSDFIRNCNYGLLYMTAAEQLKFLESLSGVDVIEIKQKINKDINAVDNEISLLKKSLSTYNNIIDDLQQKIRRIKIRDYSSIISRHKIIIKMYQQEIDEKNDYNSRAAVNNDKLAEMDRQDKGALLFFKKNIFINTNDIETKILDIKGRLNDISSWNSNYDLLQNKRRELESKTKANNTKQSTYNKLKHNQNLIIQNMRQEYPNAYEDFEIIDEHRAQFKSLKRATEIESKLSKLKQSYDVAQTNYKSIKCPGCKMELFINEENKVDTANNVIEYTKLRAEYDNIKALPPPKISADQYKWLEVHYTKWTQNNSYISPPDLTNTSYLEEEINNLAQYSYKNNELTLLNELENKLTSARRKNAQWLENMNILLRPQLKHIPMIDTSTLISRRDWNIKYVEDMEKLSSINNTNLALSNQIDELKQKQVAGEESIIQLTSKINKLISIKKKIAAAEAISIKNIITFLNYHINKILEGFFDNIITFKFTNESSISYIIFYEGREHKNIKTLSFGEQQRIQLATYLSLSLLFQAPIIFIDELTNNLDTETAENVYSTIKRFFPDKLLLIIAHQAVEGLFDHIINI